MAGRSAEDLPRISPTFPALNLSGSALAVCVCWSSARHPLRLSGCALSLSLLLSVSASLILSGCGFLPRSVPAGCLPSFRLCLCSSLSGSSLLFLCGSLWLPVCALSLRCDLPFILSGCALLGDLSALSRHLSGCVFDFLYIRIENSTFSPAKNFFEEISPNRLTWVYPMIIL